MNNDLWVVIHLNDRGKASLRAPGVKLSVRNNLDSHSILPRFACWLTEAGNQLPRVSALSPREPALSPCIRAAIEILEHPRRIFVAAFFFLGTAEIERLNGQLTDPAHRHAASHAVFGRIPARRPTLFAARSLPQIATEDRSAIFGNATTLET